MHPLGKVSILLGVAGLFLWFVARFNWLSASGAGPRTPRFRRLTKRIRNLALHPASFSLLFAITILGAALLWLTPRKPDKIAPAIQQVATSVNDVGALIDDRLKRIIDALGESRPSPAPDSGPVQSVGKGLPQSDGKTSDDIARIARAAEEIAKTGVADNELLRRIAERPEGDLTPSGWPQISALILVGMGLVVIIVSGFKRSIAIMSTGAALSIAGGSLLTVQKMEVNPTFQIGKSAPLIKAGVEELPPVYPFPSGCASPTDPAIASCQSSPEWSTLSTGLQTLAQRLCSAQTPASGLVILVGSADKQGLSARLRQNVGYNDGVAIARAEYVKAELEKRDSCDRKFTFLTLSSGPRLRGGDISSDRGVRVLAFTRETLAPGPADTATRWLAAVITCLVLVLSLIALLRNHGAAKIEKPNDDQAN